MGALLGAITEHELILKRQRVCDDRTDATWAE